MLQFLQTGKALYVLGAICVLGMISKLVTSSLYKRLIKETGNMALTKNKNLRALKQKTENQFLVSHGFRNASVYIEKQLYSFRFLKVSLESWDNLSVQAMLLCFLLGGAAAFGAYWYRCDPYYIVLYGAVGILSGIFLALIDNSTNIDAKRQQLADTLVDYVENSPHFYRNVENLPTEMEKRGKIASSPLRARVRTEDRKGIRNVGDLLAGEQTVVADEKDDGTKRVGRFSVLPKKKEKAKDPEAQEGRKNADEIRSGTEVMPHEGGDAPEGDELAKSIEHLRMSLEQIAAGRETNRQAMLRQPEKTKTERLKKEFNQEDLKLIGELLQEYLT